MLYVAVVRLSRSGVKFCKEIQLENLRAKRAETDYEAQHSVTRLEPQGMTKDSVPNAFGPLNAKGR